jgi:hypothetical protein
VIVPLIFSSGGNRDKSTVEVNFGKEGMVVRVTRLQMYLGLKSSEEPKKKEEE